MRMLIAEDNARLSEWLAKLLRGENYVVDCVENGAEAVHCLALNLYDLAIIDLDMPVMSGLEVIRKVRAQGISLPILILTADDLLTSRVAGLNAGADDYLAKPFEVPELEARLRALLRRAHTTLRPVIAYGPLSFDQNTRLFSMNGTELALSPRERSALETLIRRAGMTVSKEDLLENSYGFDDDVNPSTVEIVVHRLRKKLGTAGVSIVTLRGLGYLLRLAGP